MVDLNVMLCTGQISLNELTSDQISEWAAWEPDPPLLTNYSLDDQEERADFLYQYCWYGEPLLMGAVAHIWDSLAEPRLLRCALIGQASGAGGTGKMALVNMLNKMLTECNLIGTEVPGRSSHPRTDAYHGAMMDHFSAMAAEERALCQAYGEILDGANHGL